MRTHNIGPSAYRKNSKLELKKCLSDGGGQRKSWLTPALATIVLLLFGLTASPVSALIQVPNRHTVAFIPGDLVIGILVPVHERPSPKQAQTRTCGAVREQYGIQRVEAAFRTIDSINADPSILPNITLGIEIRDSCWHSPIALEQSIEFIRDAMAASEQTQARPVSGLSGTGSPGTLSSAIQFASSGDQTAANLSQMALNGAVANSICAPLLARQQQQQAKKVKNIVGVVGPASSTDTVQVQNLLQLFNMPQVGYSATSRDLSNKNFFKYFLRVVPSDKLQAQVMIDLMLAHNWTYITVAYTEGSYGSSLMNAFRERAQEAGICFATLESMPPNADDAKFDELIEAIQKHPNARVVLCMCEGRTVGKLFSGFKRRNIAEEYLVVGSDGWSDRFDVVERQEEFALGGISIRIHSAYVNDFDDYYFNLSPFTNHRNPWFAEFWETRFQCNLELNSNNAPHPGTSNSPSSAMNLRPSGQQQSPQQQQRPFVRPPGAKVYNRTCTGRESLRNNHKQDAKMAFVQKSIITMALGLDSMQRAICPAGRTGLCPEMLPVNGSTLLQHLMNVSFSFLDEEVYFDEQGDPPGKYEILNFQRRRPPPPVASNGWPEGGATTDGDANQDGQVEAGAGSGEDGALAASPGPGGYLATNNGLPDQATSSAEEVAEKRRQNPLYDSYSTLKVFKPRENGGHATVRARRASRQGLRRTPQQAHPPASGYSSTSGYEYVHVGSWKSSDGLSFFDHIRWPATMSDLEEGAGQIAAGDYLSNQAPASEQAAALTPKSVCSLPCAKGHAKKIQSDSVKCCWVCVPCRPNEYLFNEFKCKACEKGWWPNAAQTGCEQIPIQYLDWRSAEALTAISIALVGLSLTAATALVFIRHNNTPVVKSTTRELSYMILFAMFLCYANTFLLVTKPRKVTCFATRILPGFAFAMMYGALVTKTNRIARILAGSKKKIITRRLRFMSATSQVAITWIIVLSECLIIVSMLIREPADKMLDYPSDDRVVLVCNTTTLAIIVPLGFDFFLIAMCTLYAFKTRNVPENFNEAKFIGFTMYTTLVIWAACVVIYLSSEHKVTTLCLCISFSALIALFLLFFPRCYIIIFKPEKNNRSFFTTTKMVRCHIGYQLGSAGAAAAAAAAAALNQQASSSNGAAATGSPALQQVLGGQQCYLANNTAAGTGTGTGTGTNTTSNTSTSSTERDQQLRPDLDGQLEISAANFEAALQGKPLAFSRHGASGGARHYAPRSATGHRPTRSASPADEEPNRNLPAAKTSSRHSAGAEWPTQQSSNQPDHSKPAGLFGNFLASLFGLFVRRSRRKEFDKASSIQQHLRAIRHAENLDRQTHFRRSQVQRLVQRFDSAPNQSEPLQPSSCSAANTSGRRQRLAEQLALAACAPEDRDRFIEALGQMIGAQNVFRLVELLRRYCEQRRTFSAEGAANQLQKPQQPQQLRHRQGQASPGGRELVLSVSGGDFALQRRQWPLRLELPADRKLALTLMGWLGELARQASDELANWRATAPQELEPWLADGAKTAACSQRRSQPEIICAPITSERVDQRNMDGVMARQTSLGHKPEGGNAPRPRACGAEIRREPARPNASAAGQQRRHQRDSRIDSGRNNNNVSTGEPALVSAGDKLALPEPDNSASANGNWLDQSTSAAAAAAERATSGEQARRLTNGPQAAQGEWTADIGSRTRTGAGRERFEPSRKLEVAEDEDEDEEARRRRRQQVEPDPIRRALECIMGKANTRRKVADVLKPVVGSISPARKLDELVLRERTDKPVRLDRAAAATATDEHSAAYLHRHRRRHLASSEVAATCARSTKVLAADEDDGAQRLVCCRDNAGQIGAAKGSPDPANPPQQQSRDGEPSNRRRLSTNRDRSPQMRVSQCNDRTPIDRPPLQPIAPVSSMADKTNRDWPDHDRRESNQASKDTKRANGTSFNQVMDDDDDDAKRSNGKQQQIGKLVIPQQRNNLDSAQLGSRRRDSSTCPTSANDLKGRHHHHHHQRRRRRSSSANCCCNCDLPECCRSSRHCDQCNRHRRRQSHRDRARGRSRSAATRGSCALADGGHLSPGEPVSAGPSGSPSRCGSRSNQQSPDDADERTGSSEPLEDYKL